MSANPVANGGLVRQALGSARLPRAPLWRLRSRGATLAGNVATLGNFLRELMRLNMHNFRVFRAGRDAVQPAPGPL